MNKRLVLELEELEYSCFVVGIDCLDFCFTPFRFLIE